MATTCTASGNISTGDAVCVVAFDSGNSRPTVARATRANLATSKTVFGVARETKTNGQPISVNAAGEVTEESISSLGAGDSRIIATDINQAVAADQCRLIRVDRPNGSEHVVGSCDANGNLAIQPRASVDQSARHVVNVRAYGARANGKVVNDVSMNGTGDVTAAAGSFTPEDEGKTIRISNADGGAPLIAVIDTVDGTGAIATLAGMVTGDTNGEPSTAILWTFGEDHVNAAALDAAIAAVLDGGTLFFPGPGMYVVRKVADEMSDDPADITFPANVELLFDDGAVLVPASARATINGRVTAHPLQQIFGGAGRVDAVAGPDAFLSVSGDPYSNYAIEVTITDTGVVGVSQFTYSVNGNNDLDHGPSTKKSPTAANFPIPGTGLTLHFAANTYDEDDVYSIAAYAPIVLAPASFEHADVMSFGAKPDEDDDATRAGNTTAMHTALGALRAAGNVATSIVARGKFYFSDTIHVCQTILLRGTGRADSADVSGGGASVPGTWFFFPNDVEGIHLYSGYAAQGGSDNTQIRDLTIAVDEPEGRLVKNGITLNAIATLDHVTVKLFGGHGIFVSAGDKDPAEPGIAAGFVLNACIVGGCGGDGIQTLGSDANVGLIINCNADSNRGFGFRDRTVVNTYIGCHAAGNQGLDPEAADPMVVVYRNYAAWGPPNDESDPVVLAGPNNCVFIGCYSEGDTEAVQNMIGFGATIIGGQPGYQQKAVLRNAATTPLDIDWAGWTTSSNLIDGQPLTYDKRIPGASSADLITTTVEVGQKTNWGNLADGATNNPGIFNFKLKAAKAGVRLLSDANVLRYAENFGWWFLEKGPGTSTLWIPGDVTPPRRIAPLFPNGIIFQTTPSLMELEDRFGPPDPETSMEMVSHTGSATRPEPPLELQTFEVGDVVWSGDTSGRGPLGWRCTKAGTWAAADPALTADVDVDGTDVTITFKDVGNDPAFAGYLELWAYVRIGEEPAPMDPDERFVVQIVSLPTALALGTVKARLVEPLTTPAEDTGLPVVFAPPVIVPFGTQATAATGAADYLFTEEAVHVACDTAPRTVTLPADPWDGAYFEIKSAGVAGADPDHITVDAGLRTIDGVNPVKIETPYGFLCVRYNASLDQWFSVAQQLT